MKKLIALLLVSISMLQTNLSYAWFDSLFGKEEKPKQEATQLALSQNATAQALQVLEVTTVTDAKPYIQITFSENLGVNKNLDSYISLNDVEFDVINFKNKILLKGNFDPNRVYKLEILKGLKSHNGLKLNDNFKADINFKEAEPKIAFANDGIILPSINQQKISFKSINIKKVKLKVKKIYPNNTTQFLQDLAFKGNGNAFSYQFDEYLYKIGDIVFEKEFTLKNSKNNWQQSEVELANFKDEQGFFIVELAFDENGIDYTFPEEVDNWKKARFFRNNAKIAKVVLFSDLGLVAQKTQDHYVVTVTNILTNSVVAGAKVQAISQNNQLIAEAIANANGEVRFDLNANQKTDVFYFLAESGKQKTILKLRDSQLSYDGFSVDGLFANAGIKGFIYTDRDIYRPHDEIHLAIIARNQNKTFPTNHPISLNIYTPTGKKFLTNHVVKNGKDGFYSYSFKTNLDSETGIWKIDAKIGDVSFSKNISIETVVPYKIKVNLDLPAAINLNQTAKINLALGADYLFGAPADGLKYESTLSLREDKIKFEKFKNYNFNNPTISRFSYDDLEKKGTLNSEGKAKFNFELHKVALKNLNLMALITTKVLETSGRPIIQRSLVKVNKFDSYIGIEQPQNNYIKVGDNLNLQAIVVSADGEKLIAGKKIQYRIYQNEYSWWWDYSSESDFVRSIKTDVHTKLLHSQTIESGVKPVLIDYPIQSEGDVFVEIKDLESGQSAGVHLNASDWTDPSLRKKVDKLKLETDRKIYNIGDTAQVIYEGAQGAKALITIEKSGRILKRFWRDVKSTKNQEAIEITEDMFPNAYVSISLFQDYNNYTNDRPLRLYGAVPLMVNNEATKLNLRLDVPQELKPNQKFKVKVKNLANSKMDYTIAIVDEGLLDITAFKTPNPWNYFYQKEAMQILTFDNYNEVIGKTLGKVHQVLKAGGDEAIDNLRNKHLGKEEVQRFKPVAMFKGVLTTDAQGEGEVEFTMPNYMGSVRVMVVAADQYKYGSAEVQVKVKAPIVMNASLPRTLKVGDKFTIPVELFGLDDELGEVKLTMHYSGKTQTQSLTLNNKDKKTLYFSAFVPNKVGADKITFKVASKKYAYQEVTDINVHSNNPYVYFNELKIIPQGGSVHFKAPENSIAGTVASQINISSSPILAIDQRLKYLIRYPYGCAEQTTSSVLPQLFIHQLASATEFNPKTITHNINAGIARLAKFQLDDGSFSYWQGQNKTDLWAGNYIAHFLILAKDNGYYVPAELLKKWVKFTKQQVKSSQYDVNKKAYSLYLLAAIGEPDISTMNMLYENHLAQLSLVNKWLLASAYKLIGEEQMALALAQGLSVQVPTNDDHWYRYSYGSKLRDKAIMLNAYYKIYGKVENTLYTEILQALQSSDWLSTQSVGYSLLALADMSQPQDSQEISGNLEINGKAKKFTTQHGKYRLSLPENVRTLKITTTNPHNSFVNYFWEGVPINYEREDIAKNLQLERYFYDDYGNEINPEHIASGQSFWLEIKVGTVNNRYININEVALTQVLPTGWEIENLRALNQEYPAWVQAKMRGTNIDYQDIRDDRVMWFFDYQGSSSRSFFIKLNAVTVGEYKFPATVAEAMYDQNYEAYLSGFDVSVETDVL